MHIPDGYLGPPTYLSLYAACVPFWIAASPQVAMGVGPWAAIITSSIALAIQALLFGDGGILSLGANCFNMSVVGSLVGYYFYRMLSWNSQEASKRRLI